MLQNLGQAHGIAIIEHGRSQGSAFLHVILLLLVLL